MSTKNINLWQTINPLGTGFGKLRAQRRHADWQYHRRAYVAMPPGNPYPIFRDYPKVARSGNSAKLEWEKVNEVSWKLTDGNG